MWNVAAENLGRAILLLPGDHRYIGCLGCVGCEAAGPGSPSMGDPEQSLLYDQHDPEAEARLETGRDSDALGPPSAGYESLRSGASAYQDLSDGKLGFEDQEEEILPEEVAGDEFLDAQDPGEAVPELERVLRTDEEEDEVPETRCAKRGAQARARGAGQQRPSTPGPEARCSRSKPGPPGPMRHPRVRARQTGRAAPSLASAAKSANDPVRAASGARRDTLPKGQFGVGGSSDPELGGPGGRPTARQTGKETGGGSPSWEARPPEPHASPWT